jgi:DNA-binding transcriptional MerR regulator
MATAFPRVYGANSPIGPTMPADGTETKKRETWLDWMPDGSEEPRELLSREAFIARLNALGVDVSESDLRFWEYHGVLPRAVKKWRDGANRVYYPRWMIQTVTLLRALQGVGLPLRDVVPHLKKTVADAISVVETIDQLGQRPDADTTGTAGDKLLRFRAQKLARFVLMESLEPEIKDLARRYEAVTSSRVGTIRVFFESDDGTELDRYDLDFNCET